MRPARSLLSFASLTQHLLNVLHPPALERKEVHGLQLYIDTTACNTDYQDTPTLLVSLQGSDRTPADAVFMYSHTIYNVTQGRSTFCNNVS